MKPNIDIYRVKHFLNLVYLTTLVRAIDAAKTVDASKQAVDDAAEVRAYKDRLWFESHARHSFFASADGRIYLCRHHCPESGSISAASSRHSSSRKAPKQDSSTRFYGTKLGRVSSLPPLTAANRRGAA